MNQLRLWRAVGIISSILLMITIVLGGLWAWQNNRDTVVAKVGDHNLYYSEWFSALKDQYGREVLDNLIDQYVIQKTAEQLGIEISDEVVQQEIAKQKEQYVTEEEFLQTIGITLDELEKQIRQQLYLEAIAIHDVQISDADIEQYYEENIDLFTERAAMHLYQIVVDTKEEANRIISELQDGAEFAALAQEQSTDVFSAANGGDLGWVTNEDPSIHSNVLEAAEELAIGEISEPIPVFDGYAIIKIEERRERQVKPLQDVKDEIYKQLALAQVDSLNDVLTGLKKEQGIKIHKMFVEDESTEK